MTDRSRHWADLNEVTFGAGTRLLYRIHAVLGRWPFLVCLWPVVFCYWLFYRSARHASEEYLRRWRAFFPADSARAPSSLGHFLRFADVLLDKLIASAGAIPASRIESLEMEAARALIDTGRGGLIVTAHIGCLELCQALAGTIPGLRINVLVHTRHAQRFNALLSQLHPDSPVRLLQVTEITPVTAVDLEIRVGRGEFVAIVGDRIPVSGGRTASASFLGEDAEFPVGPWVLAGLLRCPVLLMSCLGTSARLSYRIRLDHFADRIEWSRSQRVSVLAECVNHYSQWLQQRVFEAPSDWFNFFDFWRQRGSNVRN